LGVGYDNIREVDRAGVATWPVTVRELPTLVTIGLAQALLIVNAGTPHVTLKLQVALLVTVWPGYKGWRQSQ